MTTQAQREEAEALERLAEWVKPGDTLRTILRHVSQSGMSRVIDVISITVDDGKPVIGSLGWNTARALGYKFDREREGLKVGGAGMDMGFHVVYSLARGLFPDGFECIGEDCPSNDHSNGDRDYAPHHHGDGGYALRHRWL